MKLNDFSVISNKEENNDFSVYRHLCCPCRSTTGLCRNLGTLPPLRPLKPFLRDRSLHRINNCRHQRVLVVVAKSAAKRVGTTGWVTGGFAWPSNSIVRAWDSAMAWGGRQGRPLWGHRIRSLPTRGRGRRWPPGSDGEIVTCVRRWGGCRRRRRRRRETWFREEVANIEG